MYRRLRHILMIMIMARDIDVMARLLRRLARASDLDQCRRLLPDRDLAQDQDLAQDLHRDPAQDLDQCRRDHYRQDPAHAQAQDQDPDRDRREDN